MKRNPMLLLYVLIFFICLSVLVLTGLIRRDAEKSNADGSKPETEGVKPVTSTIGMYLEKATEGGNAIVLKVFDATVNNPIDPRVLTLTVEIEGNTKFLQIDIRKSESDVVSMNTSHLDTVLYTEYENPFTYLDTQTELPYPQYVEITRASQPMEGLGGFSTLKYQTYKCDIYLQQVKFGENSNGKSAATPSMQVGE